MLGLKSPMSPYLFRPISALTENWYWLSAILWPLSTDRVDWNRAWDDPFLLPEEKYIHTGPSQAPPALPLVLCTEPLERSAKNRAPQVQEEAFCSEQSPSGHA